MEEYNKSSGANNHTSLLSHAQSQSPDLHMNISRFEKVRVNLKSVEWSSRGLNSFAIHSDINFMKIVNFPTDAALLTLLLPKILNIL